MINSKSFLSIHYYDFLHLRGMKLLLLLLQPYYFRTRIILCSGSISFYYSCQNIRTHTLCNWKFLFRCLFIYKALFSINMLSLKFTMFFFSSRLFHGHKHTRTYTTERKQSKQKKNYTHTYFRIHSDTLLHVLQFLDVINMKDPTQKAHFYKSTLREALPFIPRVM